MLWPSFSFSIGPIVTTPPPLCRPTLSPPKHILSLNAGGRSLLLSASGQGGQAGTGPRAQVHDLSDVNAKMELLAQIRRDEGEMELQQLRPILATYDFLAHHDVRVPQEEQDMVCRAVSLPCTLCCVCWHLALLIL